MLITVLPLTRWHQAVSSVAKVEKIEMSGKRLTNPGSAGECPYPSRRSVAEDDSEALAARRAVAASQAVERDCAILGGQPTTPVRRGTCARTGSRVGRHRLDGCVVRRRVVVGDSAGDLHNVLVRDLPEQGNGRCGIGDQMMLVQVPAPSVRAQADEHAVDQRPADRQRARAPRVCPRQEQALSTRSPGEVLDVSLVLVRVAAVAHNPASALLYPCTEHIVPENRSPPGGPKRAGIDWPFDDEGERHVVEGAVRRALLTYPDRQLAVGKSRLRGLFVAEVRASRLHSTE